MSSESFQQEALLITTTDDIVGVTVEAVAEKFGDLISSQIPDWPPGSEELDEISWDLGLLALIWARQAKWVNV